MKYLLVGGCNTLIKDGFGVTLRERLNADWELNGLGDSCSLRGVDYLLLRKSQLGIYDKIFFEYTLNDGIFETFNTIDPFLVRRSLTCLCQHVKPKQLVFILLGNKSAIQAYYDRRVSPIRNAYLAVAKQFGVQCIDCFKKISDCYRKRDIFVHNPSHFDKETSTELAEYVISCIKHDDQKEEILPLRVAPHIGIEHVSPSLLPDSVFQGIKKFFFKTSLLKSGMIMLPPGSSVTFKSPGGILVGFYAIKCKDTAGAISIRVNNYYEVFKIMATRAGLDKQYYALMHFTQGILTRKGDLISVRPIPTLFSRLTSGVLDISQNHNCNFLPSGTPIIGDFLFMQIDCL